MGAKTIGGGLVEKIVNVVGLWMVPARCIAICWVPGICDCSVGERGKPSNLD